MAYIGKEPIVGNFQKCDAITVVNGQAAYTLQVSSTNVTPESANHMLVSLNGILQAPVTSFSVSGSTLTFVSNLATGDVIDFVILLGNVLDLGVPSDATVTNAKLASDLISGETDIGGAIADADLFLIDDGAGGTLRKTAASRIKTYAGGGLSDVSQWRLNATTNSGTNAVISANWEEVDYANYERIGSAITQSSGVFTFPSTGKWLITSSFYLVTTTDEYSANVKLEYTLNNGTGYTDAHYAAFGTFNPNSDGAKGRGSVVNEVLFDCTDTSNDKIRFSTTSFTTGTNLYGETNASYSVVTFMKLGDT